MMLRSNLNEKSNIGPRQVRSMVNFDARQFESLERIGINLNKYTVAKMMQGMDAVQQPLVTTASVTTPVQFLQNWLPGFVYIITSARKIDELVGIMTAGAWEDEQIVQGVMELVGTSLPYGD